MAFEDVRRVIARPQVVAGMDRMQPELRALAARMLQRFERGDAAPRDVTEEGAALALWGREHVGVFLAWHRDVGGLARALEVVLAAIGFYRATYEWDSSVWALRRARPAQGLVNLELAPWLWLRRERVHEDAAAQAIAGPRTWLVRAALAFVFPERWTGADEAELRQADADDRAARLFGIAAALRRTELDVGRLARTWNLVEAIAPADIVRALGPAAVAPLRLMRAFDALRALGTDDALRALAEFADEAWDALARVAPTRATITALAELFTTHRPRRQHGVHLARALVRELAAAAPGEAPDELVAETGALLPPDTGWQSPWRAAPKQRPAAKPADPGPMPAFDERVHWEPGERERRAEEYAQRRTAESDRDKEHELREEAEQRRAFLFHLRFVSDATALRMWRAVEPKRWYGEAEDVLHVLARFALADVLDGVLAFVQLRPDALPALARVESPRVAPVMARAFASTHKRHAIGQAWLDRFPEAARIGLQHAPAGDKKQRDANAKALAHVTGAPAEPTAALPARPPKLPPFIDLARLPRPITLDGSAALAGAPLGELVQLLAANVLPDGVTARYTSASLARCSWSLFRQWLFAGAPPKHKWALHALGRFPDDDAAAALGRLAPGWATGGNSARAQEAVETLAMMRTQRALGEIWTIARKVQSKALKARAEHVFATVAAQLGLEPDELADRLVPELAETDITFGDQRATFDAHLVPHLDEPPTDPGDAARFKALKRTCAAVAREQLARLEQAMADAHRMPYAHFSEVYLMHSLLRHLAETVLWGVYRDGAPVQPFVLADGVAVDLDGRELELPLDAHYGVVHPVELDADTRAAWAERLPAAPFPQLLREVFPAASALDASLALARLCGRTLPTAGLLGLARSRWRRGESPQGGRYYTMHKTGDGWAAEILFVPGIHLGAPTDEPTQVLEQVSFHADTPPPAAVLSEVQRDLVLLIGGF